MAQQRQVRWARALFKYEAVEADDLSFNEGDAIELVDQDRQDGWWQGRLNGKSGVFPSNYVRLEQGEHHSSSTSGEGRR